MKANVFGLLEANKAAGKAVDIDLLLRMDKPFDVFFDGDVYRRLAALIDRRKIAILDDEWDDFKGLIKPSGLPIGHSFKPIVRDKTTPCYALFRKLEVLTDGTIQACACRVEPELWGGNILDHADLESAWRDPGLEKIRADWFAGKIPDCCRRCSHYIPFTNLIASTQPKAVAKRILGKLGWGRLASR
jgi:radical SAM protein with 4Fe4S-binding SPASM domain